MLPPPQAKPASSLKQTPLTAVVSFFRWMWDYCVKEVDDSIAERKADALLVAASVIAAMNYQAALSPPGGAYQDTSYVNGMIEYQAGQSIAAYVSAYEYKRFSIANTLSFTFSMTTMFLFLSGLSLKRRIFSFLLTGTMFVTITATTYSYKLAIEATTPDHDKHKNEWIFVSRLVTGAMITWSVIAGFTFLVFLVLQLKLPLTTVYRHVTKN